MNDAESATIEPEMSDDRPTMTDPVAVSNSIGGRDRAKICHEPDDDGNPMCGSRGDYRLVDPELYPHRQFCRRRGCWSDLSVTEDDRVVG